MAGDRPAAVWRVATLPDEASAIRAASALVAVYGPRAVAFERRGAAIYAESVQMYLAGRTILAALAREGRL